MITYTVSVTETQNKALAVMMLDQQQWVSGVVEAYVKAATKQILSIAVPKCLDLGIQIPQSEEAIIELALAHNWVKTIAQLNAEAAIRDATRNQQG